MSGVRSRRPSTARLTYGGVPIFPNTREGQAERLAYYEARRLNHPPNSLLDYNDVIRGRETPGERRARERRTTGRGPGSGSSPSEAACRSSRILRRPGRAVREALAPSSWALWQLSQN
jgi:hypothetical protein